MIFRALENSISRLVVYLVVNTICLYAVHLLPCRAILRQRLKVQANEFGVLF